MISSYFIKEICILFFGGLTIASAIELTRLHERIALSVLVRFGSNPKWFAFFYILFSFWLSCDFQ